MTPEYVAIRAEMTAREALDHVRQTGRGKETVNVLYVLDEQGKLIADIRLGTLVMADPDAESPRHPRRIDGVSAGHDRPRGGLRTFEKYDRIALPVTDGDGHMLGIITIDDVLDVASQEATEDIQKIGGSEALDAPYLDVRFRQMVRKRGVLALGAVSRRNADGDRDGLLRGRNRQGGRPGPVRAARSSAAAATPARRRPR